MSRAIKKPKVGDLVEVIFYDHAQNSKDVLLFEMFGRVTKITKKGYLIHTWRYLKEVDRAVDTRDDNEDWFAIVKSAIESIRILK